MSLHHAKGFTSFKLSTPNPRTSPDDLQQLRMVLISRVTTASTHTQVPGGAGQKEVWAPASQPALESLFRILSVWNLFWELILPCCSLLYVSLGQRCLSMLVF